MELLLLVEINSLVPESHGSSLSVVYLSIKLSKTRETKTGCYLVVDILEHYQPYSRIIYLNLSPTKTGASLRLHLKRNASQDLPYFVPDRRSLKNGEQ